MISMINLKEHLYRNEHLAKIACAISRLRYPSYRKEVEKRRNLDIFDYRGIAKFLPKYYTEICTDNNCFGIGFSLRNYAGYKKSYVNGWIEHGYFYADTVSDLASISFTKNIVTFGNHRESINKKLLPQKRCIKIGPYVHYADDYINDSEFVKLKKKLGKVLLVFPVHSGIGEKVQYEKAELFKLVGSVAKNFDTVLFSLFWSDITEEYVNEIEKRGYKIVSSGHRYDLYFLCRQKTIIKLADVTMSNGLGTNLVYCTYMNKPHWLINQETKTESLNKTGDKHLAFQEKNKNNCSIMEQLYSMFCNYEETLSEDKYLFCSELFGFRDVRSKSEMYDLLNSLE